MLQVLPQWRYIEMNTVIKYDQEKLEVEGLPEYVRDTEAPARESYSSISTRSLAEREAQRVSASAGRERQSQRDTGGFANIFSDVHAPRADELEALWPGVHQDFFQQAQSKRTPSFYMMIAFLAGAVTSMIVIWGYSAVSSLVANAGKLADKPTAVSAPQPVAQQPLVPQNIDPSAILKPAHATVEVQNGDTLAAIAVREYGKTSPRLLDAICRANGLRNANFLKLGQALNLPDYTPQSAQPAGSVSQ